MKKWGLKILSASLTFTLGLCAANFTGFRPAPAAKVQPVDTVENIQAPLPPPQIAEKAQSADELEEVMQPHPVSISPYVIKQLIDEGKLPSCERGGYSGFTNYESIWEKLQIKIKDEDDAVPEKCGAPAKADIYALELDGQPGKETLLKLNFGMPDSTLYLIFKHANNRSDGNAEWSLLGYLDYAYGAPFSSPSHRIIAAGKHRWLILGMTTGHGSGFGSYSDYWYEVSEKGVIPVLSYQASLYGMAWKTDPSTERKTKVLGIDFDDGLTTVTLQSSTSHRSSKGDQLWTSNRKVVFVKGPGMREFIFSPLHSEMTRRELDPNYGNNEFITVEEFLKYNYRELTRIAARGNAKQKEWLRNYLDTCDESLAKQSLQAALGDKQP